MTKVLIAKREKGRKIKQTLTLSSRQDIEEKKNAITPTSLSITAGGYLQLVSVSLINYLSNNKLALFQGEWKEI